MAKSIRSFSVSLETQIRLKKLIETKAAVKLLSNLSVEPQNLDALKLLPCTYKGLLMKVGATESEAQKVQTCDDFKRVAGQYLITKDRVRSFNKELKAAQRWSSGQSSGGVRSGSQSSVVEALLILGMATLEERSAACHQKVTPCEK